MLLFCFCWYDIEKAQNTSTNIDKCCDGFRITLRDYVSGMCTQADSIQLEPCTETYSGCAANDDDNNNNDNNDGNDTGSAASTIIMSIPNIFLAMLVMVSGGILVGLN